MKRIIVCAALALSGCISLPAADLTTEQASSASNEQLCTWLHANGDPAAYRELRNRNAVSAKELNLAKSNKAEIGMTSLGVICSMGPPSKVNRITTVSGVREHWVYRGKRQVYIENEKVVEYRD